MIEVGRSLRIIVPVPAGDADHWARVRFIAGLLAGVDLDCDVDIVRALFAARLTARDFGDVLDQAIEAARDAREEGGE